MCLLYLNFSYVKVSFNICSHYRVSSYNFHVSIPRMERQVRADRDTNWRAILDSKQDFIGKLWRQTKRTNEHTTKPSYNGLIQHCLKTICVILFENHRGLPWDLLYLFCAPASTWWPEGIGSRMVGCVTMMVVLLLASVYSGSITAFLAIPLK